MYKKEDMDGTTVLATIRLMNKYRRSWLDRSNWYWFYRLCQEVFELFGCLLGVHKDPPEWEMMQIAAICMNWKNHRDYNEWVK